MLQPGGFYVVELPRVQFPDWPVKCFQQLQAVRRDSGPHHAAVVYLPLPRDQRAFFHAVKQSRHVRVVGNHPSLTSRQASPAGCAPRKIRSTLYCAPVSPCSFRSCSASWASLSAAFSSAMYTWFSCEAAIHIPMIVVTTTIVKRKSPAGEVSPRPTVS